jgi:hypothetical protein
LSERARIPEKQVVTNFKPERKAKKPGTALMVLRKGDNRDKDAVEIGVLYAEASTGMITSAAKYLECGRRLIAKKKEVGHGNFLKWLEDNKETLGFAQRWTSAALMRSARKCETGHTFDEVGAAEYLKKLWHPPKPMVSMFTGDHESYTPARIIEAVRKAMGSIDLDPASNEGAQEIVQATEWYGVADDGLSREWHGNVFLNPPFEHPIIAKFIDKLCDEHLADNVEQAVLLTNNSTDTKWWRRAAEVSAGVCFTFGRINFYKADGEITQPTNGQCLIYFGDDLDRFAEAFAEIGLIMVEKDA